MIFSDLHFTEHLFDTFDFEKSSKLLQYALPLLDKIIDKINNEIKPDVVICLGDLIQDNNNHDIDINRIKLVWRFFQEIKRPFYSLPGNHDLKTMNSREEVEKIMGLVVLWVKLREAGYTRTIQGLYHVLQRLGIYTKAPSKKKESEATEWVTGNYPGEKIQVDVKYVPKVCMSPELQEMGEKFYQYTAIDEYSRLRYTYASSEFVIRLVKYFPFKIKTIQTDNGFEFTNRLSWQAFIKNKKTMFEKTLEELGIEYKVIKPHTPKQNGRVERSHRKDQERFYYQRVFYSLEDLRNRGAEWRK